MTVRIIRCITLPRPIARRVQTWGPISRLLFIIKAVIQISRHLVQPVISITTSQWPWMLWSSKSPLQRQPNSSKIPALLQVDKQVRIWGKSNKHWKIRISSLTDKDLAALSWYLQLKKTALQWRWAKSLLWMDLRLHLTAEYHHCWIIVNIIKHCHF